MRYVTKLRFMMGLAQRTIEMIGSAGSPPVQIAMGELAALVSIYEGMLLAHETNAPIKDGVLWPSVVTLYAAMAMQSEFNGRMLETVRELVSSSVISQPSSVADFDNPEIAPMIERYMRSGSMDARSRTALVRLLWDFIGTEFGSRHPAIREVLRRLLVHREAERLSQFRLQTRHRAGRRRAQPAAGRWADLHSMLPRTRCAPSPLLGRGLG